MAVMIPESCPSRASKGVKTLFQTLFEKLGDDCTVWYESNVGNCFPDFVVLGTTFGLLILEVKNWYLDEIVAADNNNFTINRRGEERVEVVPSPIRQAKEYLDKILNAFDEYPVLTHVAGKHKGQPVFRIGSCIVMSNITNEEAEEAGSGLGRPSLLEVLPAARVIFANDLRSLSGMSDSAFARRMREFFQVTFDPEVLTEQQLATIGGILHPEVVVRRQAANEDSVANKSEALASGNVLVTLDARQEQLARSIGEGHRIFFGVAGSGKTLLLLARARILADAGV